MRTRWLLVSIAMLAAVTSGAPAQRVVAFELGPSMIEESSLMQAGVRFSRITPNRATADFAVATFVDALTEGAFVALTDISVAVPVGLGSDVRLVPRLGVSGLLGVGGGGSAFAPGFHVGLGAVALFAPRSGIRIDYTARRLTYDGASSGWNSLTFGIVFGS